MPVFIQLRDTKLVPELVLKAGRPLLLNKLLGWNVLVVCNKEHLPRIRAGDVLVSTTSRVFGGY